MISWIADVVKDQIFLYVSDWFSPCIVCNIAAAVPAVYQSYGENPKPKIKWFIVIPRWGMTFPPAIFQP